jgi:DNA-binding NtrC family response regulator
MANGTVVLLGNLRAERPALDRVVSIFGFSLQEVPTLGHLGSLDDNLVAVLFCPNALDLSGDEALKQVLGAAPNALPILCHGFADHINWPELVDAGAFHSLPMPFSTAEVRQSLGFVWEARQRPRSQTEACACCPAAISSESAMAAASSI